MTLLLLAAGLALLVAGAEALVSGARRLALRVGMSPIAIGNVVGSNVFNLFFVLGATATIRPVQIPENGLIDLFAVLVASALLWVTCSTYGGRQITHAAGWLFLAGYVGYIVARST